MSAFELDGHRLLGALGPDLEHHRPLGEHRSTYVAPPAPSGPRADLVQVVADAGLRGRGGSGFPTGTKLAAVVRSSTEQRCPPVVVVDGAESEPLSAKDEVLLRGAPHLVLDGAGWAAAAVGADRIVVALDRGRPGAVRTTEAAVAERGIEAAPIEVVTVPPKYVAGEERALVAFLNGRDAKPPGDRTRPFERGVDRRPTLVLNVETAAHVGQILQFGPGWFRQHGTAAHPGTALATVGGSVAQPGVVEAPLGTPLGRLAELAGGVTARPKAVLVGGYFGSWLPAATTAGLGWSDDQLQPWDVKVGCGAVAVLGEGRCGVHESARVLAWMAGQSAGQCGPCVHGLAAVADAMAQLAAGRVGGDVVGRLHRWAAQIEGRGACRMPDGAVRFLRSALGTFADDVASHQQGAPCPPPPDGAHLLPVPADRGGWR